MLEQFVASLIQVQPRPMKVYLDQMAFNTLRTEWKEQGMYHYSPQFLFGLEVEIIDGFKFK